MHNKVFLNHSASSEDIRCVVLARLGFSYNYIAVQTGLAAGQIKYRLNYMGIKLRQYREGQTELAKRFTTLAQMDAAQIGKELRQLLLAESATPPARIEEPHVLEA